MWLFTHMSVLPVYVQAQHGPLFHISPETCSPYNQAQIYQGSFLLTLAIICWSSPDLPLQNFNRASLFSSTLVSWHLLFPSQISKKPSYICLYVCLYIRIYLSIFFSLSAKWNIWEENQGTRDLQIQSWVPKAGMRRYSKYDREKCLYYLLCSTHTSYTLCVRLEDWFFF